MVSETIVAPHQQFPKPKSKDARGHVLLCRVNDDGHKGANSGRLKLFNSPSVQCCCCAGLWWLWDKEQHTWDGSQVQVCCWCFLPLLCTPCLSCMGHRHHIHLGPRCSLDHGGRVPYGGALARRACAGRALGIFFDPCPTSDLLGGALSAVCAQCNYLDV